MVEAEKKGDYFHLTNFPNR